MSLVAALCLALGAAPQDQDAQFASDVLEVIARDDDVGLRALVRERPEHARPLTYDLLREAAFAPPPDRRSFSAAMRIAMALELETGSGLALEAVGRFEQADDAALERRRSFHDALASAATAFEESKFERAAEGARAALDLALPLGEPYLEAQARRLAMYAHAVLYDWEDVQRQGSRAVEIELELGLSLVVGDDLRALGDLELGLGRYASALDRYQGAIQIAEDLGDSLGLAWLRVSAAGALTALGRYDDASTSLQRAMSFFTPRNDPLEMAHALSVQASLEGSAGHYGESIQLLRRAIRLSSGSGDRVAEARARLQLAGVYSELGWPAADVEVDAAWNLLEESGSELGSDALLTRGLVLLDGGASEEAVSTLAQARRWYERLRRDRAVAETLQHTATALLRLGRAAEARRLAAQAADLASLPDDPLRHSLILTVLGDASLALGQTERAAEAYANAIEVGASLPSLEGVWRAHLGLGRAREALGDVEGALLSYRAAIRDVEAIRRVLTAPALRVRYLGDKLELYRRTSFLLTRSGDVEEAFRFSEGAKARTLLELTSVRPTDAVLLRPDVEQELRDAESRLALAERRAATEASEDAVTALEGARVDHEAARLSVALRDPRYAALRGLRDVPASAELAARLGPHEAVLEYVVGEKKTLVFVLRAGGLAARELEIGAAALDERVQSLLDPFERLRKGLTDIRNLGFDSRSARELYDSLIAPLTAELAGCDTLWIVPDGPLRRLPFGLLVSRREKRPVDLQQLYAQHRDCRFLIEDFAVGVLPIAGLLDSRGDAPPGGDTLVLADPRPLPRRAHELVSARAEARSVRDGASGEARLLVGEAALEAELKSGPLQLAALHLATHGVLDDVRPAYSRLALAPGAGEDGWLHAHEIEGLDLSVGRVVLSACESVGTHGRGEGLLGLARAFLVAGARSVVATTWIVDDEATAFLMERYQRALATGEPAVRALQTAQIATLRAGERGGLLYVHPFFWAAFQHVGAE